VSRWLKQVNAYLRAGNVLPELPAPLKEKPKALDPKVLDMGKNQDGRTLRQRSRGNSNADGK
jgi:hypothetical protein